MAMPAKYREQLMDLCQGELVVTINPKRHLLLFAKPRWLDFEEQLLEMPSLDDDAEVLQQVYVGFAHEVDMDKAGRVLLPPSLRNVANIERKLVLLGMGARFELWPEQQWVDNLDNLLDRAAAIQKNKPDIFKGVVM